MKSYLKAAGKWLLIVGGFALVGSWVGDLAFETRTNIFLMCLALGIAYTEGSLKDRIEMLEYRVDEHRDRLNGQGY